MNSWKYRISELNKEAKIDYTNFNKNDLIFEEFKPFFEDEDNLKFFLNLEMLNYNYKFYTEALSGTLYQEMIYEFVHLYHDIRKISKQQTENLFVELFPKITEGINNLALTTIQDCVYKEKIRLDLYIKSIFSDIGDILEGSLKPFLLLFYGFYLIKDSEPNVNYKITNSTYGELVNYMINKNEIFGAIYKIMLLNINISQWRNIAYHKSYSATEDGDIVVRYGHNNRNIKKISKEEFDLIPIALNFTYMTHKIAYDLIGYDSPDLLKKCDGKKTMSIDTIIASIIEITSSTSLKLTDFDDSIDPHIFRFENQGDSIKLNNPKQSYSLNFLFKSLIPKDSKVIINFPHNGSCSEYIWDPDKFTQL